MTKEEYEELLNTLKDRFEKNMDRHVNIQWKDIESKLEQNDKKLSSLLDMERTGGQPDVVGYDKDTKEYIFYDCSEETPLGRRNLCYDREALDARKKFKSENSAMDMANDMGIEILTEDEYKELQSIGKFDLKTSSWIKTPSNIRKLGGALFCDRRYDSVFVYHNGADSYYAGRGFRGKLRM